ncbi:MAG: NAD(P)H-dependent oxidoreductase [Rickettsiales bacterium]
MTNILMFSGSARRESFNKKLISAAAKIAREKSINVTLIDLADYPMPIYDGDLEEEKGQPENAKKLYELIKNHDYILISSPEYNGLPTPLLKNVIDWVSRVDVKVYSGKIAAIIGASPGGFGGLRALPHLRALLTNINVVVIPQQLAVPKAHEAFDADGNLKDKKQKEALESVINNLISIKR